MSKRIPCPNPECDEGTVYIYNAYAEDPLKPEAEICEICLGRGYVISAVEIAMAN